MRSAKVVPSSTVCLLLVASCSRNNVLLWRWTTWLQQHSITLWATLFHLFHCFMTIFFFHSSFKNGVDKLSMRWVSPVVIGNFLWNWQRVSFSIFSLVQSCYMETALYSSKLRTLYHSRIAKSVAGLNPRNFLKLNWIVYHVVPFKRPFSQCKTVCILSRLIRGSTSTLVNVLSVLAFMKDREFSTFELRFSHGLVAV